MNFYVYGFTSSSSVSSLHLALIFTLCFYFYLTKKALFTFLTEQISGCFPWLWLPHPPISLWGKCHSLASLLRLAFLSLFLRRDSQVLHLCLPAWPCLLCTSTSTLLANLAIPMTSDESVFIQGPQTSYSFSLDWPLHPTSMQCPTSAKSSS